MQLSKCAPSGLTLRIISALLLLVLMATPLLAVASEENSKTYDASLTLTLKGSIDNIAVDLTIKCTAKIKVVLENASSQYVRLRLFFLEGPSCEVSGSPENLTREVQGYVDEIVAEVMRYNGTVDSIPLSTYKILAGLLRSNTTVPLGPAAGYGGYIDLEDLINYAEELNPITGNLESHPLQMFYFEPSTLKELDGLNKNFNLAPEGIGAIALGYSVEGGALSSKLDVSASDSSGSYSMKLEERAQYSEDSGLLESLSVKGTLSGSSSSTGDNLQLELSFDLKSSSTTGKILVAGGTAAIVVVGAVALYILAKKILSPL